MKIKRTLDTSTATYDILGLNRQELNLLTSAYKELICRMYNDPTDNNELLNKLEAMLQDDVKII